VKVARTVMWGSLGLLAWTHVGYPLAAAGAARLRRYRARADEEYSPAVALVITAHNEESVIAERLENALQQDYPRERLDIVVASDGSTDGTAVAVASFADRGVRLLELPRAGKVSAQNAAVEETGADVVAFSDANSLWEPDALRLLIRNLADAEVGYVCGRVDVNGAGEGDSRESLYWRYELWLREQESGCGSVTAGNGGIYAVRRSAFLQLGPEHSHDLGLPFRLRRRGLRSVYEPDAVAREPALTTTRAEGARKVRMLSRAWWEVLRGGLLDPRGQPPLYFAALVSHRVLRYAAAPLHVLLFFASVRLASRDEAARSLTALQLGFGALALAGRRRPDLPLAGAAWYYTVMTGASLAGLLRVLTQGPHVTWAPTREVP
jgi:cellulose synthase/poly-beta-1,6-N-acetylglucosamine synthase-like glycosyltransferase